MPYKKTRFSLFLPLMLGACASSNSLVYSSTQVIGLSVKSSTETGNVPSLSIGYTLSDVAFVPVAVDTNKKIVRGCYRSATKALEEPCQTRDGNPTLTQSYLPKQNARFKRIQALNEFDSNSRDQHLHDGFSVFGKFDSDSSISVSQPPNGDNGVKLSGDTGIKLGKVFATGAAAQHIGEGLSLNIRREPVKQSHCLRSLNAVISTSATTFSATELADLIKQTCPGK